MTKNSFDWLFLLGLLGSSVLSARSAQGQVLYTSQQLNPTCVSGAAMIARGLNNHGTVVGRASPCGSLAQLPFRWTPATGVQYLNLGPGIGYGWATCVHDDGTIVGFCGANDNAVMKGFIWNEGAYELFAAPNPADYVHAQAVDASGLVCGYFYANNGSSLIPFFWKDGTFLPTGLEGASLNYFLFGMNDSGIVVGRHTSPTPPVSESFRLIAGELGYISLPSGHDTTEVWAVNRQGTMAGRLRKTYAPGVSTKHSGFIAEADESVPVLPLEELGHNNCELRDINDLGQAVGKSNCNDCGASGVPSKAILVQNGVVRNLNDLLAEPVSFKLLEGWAINDRGQIACTSTTSKNLVLLTPIVEPPDITIDGKVDQHDLALVLEHWGQVGLLTPLRADVDESGVIDGYDLAAVLGAWTPR